jgi:hypothetical protein
MDNDVPIASATPTSKNLPVSREMASTLAAAASYWGGVAVLEDTRSL